MKNSLIYMVKQPLYDRDLERHGILRLHADGFQIVVIDLTEILHPETPRPAKPSYLPDDVKIIEPADWRAFEALEDKIRCAKLVFLFIQSYGLSASTLRPLKMLARTQTPYAIQGTTSMPGLTHQVYQPMLQPLSTWWSRLRSMDLKNSIVSRLSPGMFDIPMAKYALVPCAEETSIIGNSLVGPKTKIVPLHSSDYESFWKSGLSSTADRTTKTNKAVFIDQNTPYHIDYNEINARKIIPENYYAQLRATFDLIEEKTGVQIEVARHPRAQYKSNDPRFGGRPAFKGQTMKMIAECDLVLAHHSTAIGYAVLLFKPIAFLISNEIYHRHPADQACFDALSSELGSPLRKMDALSDEKFEDLFDIDVGLYKRYAARYLRHADAEDAPYWDAAKTAMSEIATLN